MAHWKVYVLFKFSNKKSNLILHMRLFPGRSYPIGQERWHSEVNQSSFIYTAIDYIVIGDVGIMRKSLIQ